uniref:Uncharacterized protein n=1 Tax=Caulobacter phage BL57 TaxID=3348355 RepID=A0AB74UJ52_9VIRU
MTSVAKGMQVMIDGQPFGGLVTGRTASVQVSTGLSLSVRKGTMKTFIEEYHALKKKSARSQAYKLRALLDEIHQPERYVRFERDRAGFYHAQFLGTTEQYQAIHRFITKHLFGGRWRLSSLKPLIHAGELDVVAMDENRTPLTLAPCDFEGIGADES